MNATEQKPFAEWIGRQSESFDVVSERLVQSFRAIFEPHLAPVAAGFAPLGIHWCLSPAIAAMDQLGADGHPAMNLSLPPVPQPRRMWAGGELQVHDALRIGDEVRRVSTIRDIVRKQGRSGELWFVAVDHRYHTSRGIALSERHDIVYREAAVPKHVAPDREKTAPAPGRPVGRSWTVVPSSTLLFRYSAITFNGHRIHYDLPYATQAEGYEGLVVHGPLQATLMLNLAAAHGTGIPATFRYRGVAPAIAGRRLTIAASPDAQRFWAQGDGGVVHMEADVGRDPAP
ncbi:MaoC family dehydratase N-terminal domain-containing protein [Mesorhizobium sp. BH1-1-5]|uniref:FAS1-like dehydratase domain-containing protein n=1 Tax=unclassified Mesorhizobium TaxID=325217 RepID=UPI001127E53B|nr:MULTISPECIES: MaoC family dehydratase N-terminal domain-containing protein [unclassified Mesorhizobium]MBZ9985840.1 MaoC family dehydratase N-terminal domain-containing protein [Mesorhizobium sp. BH1-1-5]TPJ69611.1 protein dehydratase [Mesorhizobium sp. B2-7-1]